MPGSRGDVLMLQICALEGGGEGGFGTRGRKGGT